MSKLVADSSRQSNIYGGAYDHQAAIQIILRETGVKNIQVIAHCVGSVTLWAGLLNGDIEGVGSVVSSQVATHPMLSTANKIKQSLQLVTLFEKVLKQDEFSCLTHSPEASPLKSTSATSTTAEPPVKGSSTLLDRAIDNALRLLPMPVNEYCNNAICHRSSFCFGLLWEHDMISKNFHDNLGEIMGSINIESLKGLVTLWSKKQTLTDAEGNNVVTTENFHREIFNKMPVLLIHGAKNQVFTPESTLKTVEELRETLLPETNMTFDYKGLYRREVIPGYGHLDCIVSDRAYKDVYPFILNHLETYSETTGYGAQNHA